LTASPPFSFTSSMTSLKGARVSTVVYILS
jgi:hypothetical protein